MSRDEYEHLRESADAERVEHLMTAESRAEEWRAAYFALAKIAQQQLDECRDALRRAADALA